MKEGYETFVKKNKYTNDYSLELVQKHSIEWILMEFLNY